jgi:hypothetical protein
MGSRIRKSRRGRSRSRKSPKTRKLRQRSSPYKLRRRSRSPRFFNFRRLSPAPTTQAPVLPPPKAQVLASPKAYAPPPTQSPQPQVQVLLQVQPIKNVSASEIVIQRAATQKTAQSALASQLEAYKEAERQRLLSLQSIAEQQANDLKSKKGQGEGEGEGEVEGEEGEKRPLVPAINAAGPQCGSLVCRKREKCIEGICTKTRLNVNFPKDDALEEIRIIAT